MNWSIDFKENNYTGKTLNSLQENGFAVINNFFTSDQVDTLISIGKKLKQGGREHEVINYALALAEENQLQSLVDLYFQEECCFSGNTIVKFSSPTKDSDRIQNYNLDIVKTHYSTGANRGLHHDLHGMGNGPFSFGGDKVLYKLNQDSREYGVLRAWIFLTNHNNLSGTIQFLSKKNADNYYLGSKEYSSPENINEVEKHLVNPNIGKTSLLLFNKSVLHSARALRRTPSKKMKCDERGIHPINELISIGYRKGTCPYPGSRNFVAWDYARMDDHGEKLITNVVFMYIFYPLSKLWKNGKDSSSELLQKFSQKIFDVKPMLIQATFCQDRRIRLDLSICASVLYVAISRLYSIPETELIHTASNNCIILLENDHIIDPFIQFYDYKTTIMKLSSYCLNHEVDKISDLLNRLSNEIENIAKSNTKQIARKATLYYDNAVLKQVQK